MNGPQESITIYSPDPTGRQFIIYTRSKMIESHNELGLKVGDTVCVNITSFGKNDTLEIIQELLSQNVTIISKNGPLKKACDSRGQPEYKIKALDASFSSKDDK